MQLKTLTVEQTNIWISNIKKVLNLHSTVKTYVSDEFSKRKEEAETKVLSSLWLRFIYSVDSWDDIHERWDGKYYGHGLYGAKSIKQITRVPVMLALARHHLVTEKDRYLKLNQTNVMWEKYAEQPFQINNEDLEMYLSLFETHNELKRYAVEFGLYNETYNLDEDCI